MIQATCALRSLLCYTGPQAVYGICSSFTRELNEVILSIMEEHPLDRRSVRDIAKLAGRAYRLIEGQRRDLIPSILATRFDIDY